MVFTMNYLKVFAAAALLLSAASASAEESYLFTFAHDNFSPYILGMDGTEEITSGTVHCAFELRAEDAARLAGNRITELHVISPTTLSYTCPSNLTYIGWITDDLTKTCVKAPTRQGAKFSTIGLSENVLKLNTPYEIPENSGPLYIGYSFTLPSVSDLYYYPADNFDTDCNNSLFAVTSKITDVPAEFTNFGRTCGSLYMMVKIEGDNLPKNIVETGNLILPTYATAGAEADYVVGFTNRASNPVSSLEIETTVNDAEPVVSTVAMEKPVENRERGYAKVQGIYIPNAGVNSVKTKIVKINGETPASAASQVSGTVNGITKAYERRMLVEEVVSLNDADCAKVQTLQNYLAEKYPTEAMVVQAHTGDDLACPGYAGFISKYGSTLPLVLFNREYSFRFNNYGEKEIEKQADLFYNYFSTWQSYADIEVKAEPNKSGSKLNIEAAVEFGMDTDKTHMVSFVLTEDGVEPGNLNGVARTIKYFPGISDSLPLDLKEGERYEYSTDMSLTGLSGERWHLYALLTEATTGYVVNAARVDSESSGVDGIAADDTAVTIRGGKGEITVKGAKKVEVYTLDGRPSPTAGLLPGLYIVKADGRTAKVAVR